MLELRAERDALAGDADELEGRLTDERHALDGPPSRPAAAGLRADATRAAEAVRNERRRTEEAERVAQRRAEQLLREIGWQRGRLEQLAAESDGLAALVDQQTADVDACCAARPMPQRPSTEPLSSRRVRRGAARPAR